MNNVNKQFIVMLGLDEKKQPRAAKFDLPHADAVRKAANLMGLSTAIPKGDEQKALMAKLAEGKLFASGRGLVPLVKKPVYDLLIAKLELEPAPKADPAKQVPPSSEKQPLPQVWLELKVGSTVVAPDKADPAENGWWPGVITAIKADQITLRWIDAPKQKPATYHRNEVAILPPAKAK
jgi:hypothetical protein